MKRRPVVLLVVAALVAAAVYAYAHTRPQSLVLTGLVTSNEVIVSPQVAGQLGRLLVKEGDTVKAGQLLAVLAPEELQADTAYYSQNAAGLSSQSRESEAALRFEQKQTADQIAQAAHTLAAAEAQVKAAAAEAENARLVHERIRGLSGQGVVSAQDLDQARTSAEAAQARRDSLARQVEAQRSALAMARANAEQVAVRRSQLQASEHMEAAAAAQSRKADVRLRYTQLQAPIAGVVDVLAARPGEYVTAGQPVLTLIDPDDLWVRADVEETYIDRVRVGDRITVRLPSGQELPGTVFHRGVDAGFATQRDVSRTKRDIRTFEIRLRVDNADRRLAVGMTAYVLLPVR